MDAPIGINASRSGFHRELERLQDEVLVLGSMVEKAVSRSVDALRARDVGLARALEAEDVLINRKRFEIEEAALLQIATQQPMASDLRRLAAVLHIVTDLERMGDYAAGIAHICVEIGDQPHIKPLIDIPRMGDKAVSMLRRALDAFVERDVRSSSPDVTVVWGHAGRSRVLERTPSPGSQCCTVTRLWVPVGGRHPGSSRGCSARCRSGQWTAADLAQAIAATARDARGGS